MTNKLDKQLAYLKELEEKITGLTTEKETARKEVFELLKKENLDQYKNEVATISQVERKTIKFVKTPEEILANLEKQKLVKYFTVVPEQVIAEHKEINKQFEDDIKAGTFKFQGLEVETKASPMIRFNVSK